MSGCSGLAILVVAAMSRHQPEARPTATADLAGLGHVAGEAVELGDGEDAAVPDGGEGLVEAGAVLAAGA